jgi:holliday junction DNA helicase RuvA
MIARLVGCLVDRDGSRGVIDVGGVGYEVFAPSRTLDGWDADEVVVHVATYVREDSFTLYGFATKEDRLTFERLRSVKGVGPKMALAALDTLSPGGLARAVQSGDIRALQQIPGVGKRTAERLALELKDKLDIMFSPRLVVAAPKEPPDPLPLALARLGYTKSEIDRAKAGLNARGLGMDADVADRLRASLQILSGS